MSNLTNFKQFVKDNPSLLKYVRSNDMTWQKFYEMYDLYGEASDIWKDYITPIETKVVKETTSFDFINWLKNIDMDAFQENVNSVKRVIGVLQELGTKDTNPTTSEYKPRPLYKHFED